MEWEEKDGDIVGVDGGGGGEDVDGEPTILRLRGKRRRSAQGAGLRSG